MMSDTRRNGIVSAVFLALSLAGFTSMIVLSTGDVVKAKNICPASGCKCRADSTRMGPFGPLSNVGAGDCGTECKCSCGGAQNGVCIDK